MLTILICSDINGTLLQYGKRDIAGMPYITHDQPGGCSAEVFETEMNLERACSKSEIMR